MWILTLLLFFFILGLLVTIHEFGHFMVAKKCGVHIYEFSIGMGPLIWKHIGKDKIQYSIRALPIGGYVQMAGEVDEDDKSVKKNDFMCNKPWWQRILILCAGVFNNFVLAFILLFVLALIWGANSLTPTIYNVADGSAMAQAGAQAGDTILEVNNQKVSTWDKAQLLLMYKSNNNEYLIKVKHIDGTITNLTVYPTVSKDEKGNETKVFGIQIKNDIKYGFVPALNYAVQKFGSVYDSMVTVIAGLFTGKISLSSLSGPVGIYSVVDESAKMGIEQVIYLIAFLSLNLGFVNLLPFPAFDGGHVLFVIIEVIKGKPVNKKVEAIFHTVGFALILLLMVVVTIHDIFKLF
jgi:regulator of sigma E protease